MGHQRHHSRRCGWLYDNLHTCAQHEPVAAAADRPGAVVVLRISQSAWRAGRGLGPDTHDHPEAGADGWCRLPGYMGVDGRSGRLSTTCSCQFVVPVRCEPGDHSHPVCDARHRVCDHSCVPRAQSRQDHSAGHGHRDDRHRSCVCRGFGGAAAVDTAGNARGLERSDRGSVRTISGSALGCRRRHICQYWRLGRSQRLDDDSGRGHAEHCPAWPFPRLMGEGEQARSADHRPVPDRCDRQHHAPHQLLAVDQRPVQAAQYHCDGGQPSDVFRLHARDHRHGAARRFGRDVAANAAARCGGRVCGTVLHLGIDRNRFDCVTLDSGPVRLLRTGVLVAAMVE